MPPGGPGLEELLHKCIHCGLCLPVCPTYSVTMREESSPRGRIRLMKSVRDGTLEASAAFAEEMYFCLDCQACQTACPAGVRYGELVEDARALASESGAEPLRRRLLRKAVLAVLGSRALTGAAARLLRLYGKSGLRTAVEQSGLLDLIPGTFREKHALLPHVPGPAFDAVSSGLHPAAGTSRGRVAFLSGCVMNHAFGDVHRDAVDVLTRNGFDVVVPARQPCCGSLHGHNGDPAAARRLARETIRMFEQSGAGVLVTDSAGCGAFIKEYGTLLDGDPADAGRAAALAARTRDISEFLCEKGFTPPRGGLPLRVTYHEACHLVHTQKISRQPREIIASIPGVEMVELGEATWCCGSAGIYNVARFDDSMKFLERKLAHLRATSADAVATCNPGCHIQLQYGIARSGLEMEVVHPVTLLRRAYDAETRQSTAQAVFARSEATKQSPAT